jgi:hypothetical protein
VGVKVSLIEEIRARLAAENVVSGDLEDIKQIRVGSVEESRKGTDFPTITIQLLSGEELAEHPNKQLYDEMTIGIGLIVNKLAQTGNTLYNTSDSTGALFLFEKMLNVIDKNTSGNVDNTFNSNAHFLKDMTYEVDEDSDVIVFYAKITVRTTTFTVGGR